MFTMCGTDVFRAVPKSQPRARSFSRLQQNHLSRSHEICCPENICFLASRRFEIDNRSVPGELTFDRPLMGAK